jgi:hypothetical protein
MPTVKHDMLTASGRHSLAFLKLASHSSSMRRVLSSTFRKPLVLFSVKCILTVPTLRNVLDASLSFKAHSKFVVKWLSMMPTKEKVLPQNKAVEAEQAFEPQGTEAESITVEDDEEPSIYIERVSDQPPRL